MDLHTILNQRCKQSRVAWSTENVNGDEKQNWQTDEDRLERIP